MPYGLFRELSLVTFEVAHWVFTNFAELGISLVDREKQRAYRHELDLTVSSAGTVAGKRPSHEMLSAQTAFCVYPMVETCLVYPWRSFGVGKSLDHNGSIP